MKELAKILAYLSAVLIGGALLAPPLFWGARGLMDAGWLLVLQKYPFQKYFNRSLLVSAVVLLWPLVMWLGLRGWRPRVFARDPLWKRHVGLGLLAGAGAMLVLASIYLGMGAYRWVGLPSLTIVFKVALSALVVSVLEESLFRGWIAGMIEKRQGAVSALWLTSGLFAVVHFLKPDRAVRVDAVDWLAGFALVPHMFHQFAQPLLFWGGFGTLFVLGMVLGIGALRTGSLWLSVGFHAGIVLVKGCFSKGAERGWVRLPWVGPELQIGLFPVAVLACAGLCIWFLTRRDAVSLAEPGGSGRL